MRLVYFGSGAFGLPTLADLHARHTLLAIVTQPDKPAGRGAALTPTPVGEWAAAHAPNLPLFKPAKVNIPETVDALRAFDADAWVVIAFGQKLSPALLADRFAINLHASRLPRWRGAAPIHACILAGDPTTGNSVITLADRMDAGLILAQTQRPVPPDATTAQLHDDLAQEGPALVGQVLADHASGTLAPRAQAEGEATLARKLSKADAWVNFEDSADAGRRRINALSPWPGVSVTFRGQPLKLLRAGPGGPATDALSGTIVDPAQGLVACGGGTTLRLLEVQAPGKRPMPWKDFANGSRPSSQERLIGATAC